MRQQQQKQQQLRTGRKTHLIISLTSVCLCASVSVHVTDARRTQVHRSQIHTVSMNVGSCLAASRRSESPQRTESTIPTRRHRKLPLYGRVPTVCACNVQVRPCTRRARISYNTNTTRFVCANYSRISHCAMAPPPPLPFQTKPHNKHTQFVGDKRAPSVPPHPPPPLCMRLSKPIRRVHGVFNTL